MEFEPWVDRVCPGESLFPSPCGVMEFELAPLMFMGVAACGFRPLAG